MFKVQLNVCPLCDKVLQLKQINRVNVYSCRTRGQMSQSHYEVECDKNNLIQKMYVGPYCVSNCSKSVKSKILQKYITGGGDKWYPVAESNRIYADSEDRVLSRIYDVVPVGR